jgi:hypothetical protein
MSDRLEVIPGPGAVLRIGTITAWIGPSASALLLDFVVRAAQRAPQTPTAAQALADHILGVLRNGDPERAAPFAVVGGGEGGWVALLHGPVQLWDGARLATANPNPGWLALFLGTPVVATINAAGSPPRGSSGSVFDLKEGVVPGAGFVLAPDPAGFVPTASHPRATSNPRATPFTSDPRATITPAATPSPAVAEAHPGARLTPVTSPDAPGGWGPERSSPGSASPGGATPAIPPPPAPSPHPSEVGSLDQSSNAQWPRGDFSNPAPVPGGGLSGGLGLGRLPTMIESQRVPPPPPPPTPGVAAVGELASPASKRPVVARSSAVSSPNRANVDQRPAPSLLVDLRGPHQPPGPPLPARGGAASRPVDATVVRGVRCVRNHFNHPLSPTCVHCATPIAESQRQPSDGPRPPLGILVRDDSTVFSLDSDYVLGSAPEGDPAVIGGRTLPLRLAGPATEEVSAVHAELRCSGWDVTVIDRGSAYGTFVLRPGEQVWERLSPDQAHVLTPGTHLACGQRILTYASPWPG